MGRFIKVKNTFLFKRGGWRLLEEEVIVGYSIPTSLKIVDLSGGCANVGYEDLRKVARITQINEPAGFNLTAPRAREILPSEHCPDIQSYFSSVSSAREIMKCSSG